MLINQDSINISNNKVINLQMVEIPLGQITLRNDRIKYTYTINTQPFLTKKHILSHLKLTTYNFS